MSSLRLSSFSARLPHRSSSSSLSVVKVTLRIASARTPNSSETPPRRPSPSLIRALCRPGSLFLCSSPGSLPLRSLSLRHAIIGVNRTTCPPPSIVVLHSQLYRIRRIVFLRDDCPAASFGNNTSLPSSMLAPRHVSVALSAVLSASHCSLPASGSEPSITSLLP